MRKIQHLQVHFTTIVLNVWFKQFLFVGSKNIKNILSYIQGLTCSLQNKEMDLLSDLINTLPQSILIVDLDFKVILFNKTAQDKWKYSSNEFANKNILDFFSRGNASIEGLFAQSNLQAITADNQSFYVNIRRKSLNLDAGQYTMFSIEDISEKRALEQILANKNVELEMLLYKSSHSLRGPLTSILGLSNLLKTTKPHSFEWIKYLRLVDITTTKLDLELQKLANFKKIISDTSYISEIYFQDLCRGMIDSIVEANDDIPISFEIKPKQKALVKTDIGVLKIVINELIDNAIRFKRTNENAVIQLSIKEGDDYYQIIVKDNGEGIAPEIKDKIFDMYFRGSKKSEGSGLGLFLVSKGVSKLNGTIGFDSELGIGSEFTITIPYV